MHLYHTALVSFALPAFDQTRVDPCTAHQLEAQRPNGRSHERNLKGSTISCGSSAARFGFRFSASSRDKPLRFACRWPYFTRKVSPHSLFHDQGARVKRGHPCVRPAPPHSRVKRRNCRDMPSGSFSSAKARFHLEGTNSLELRAIGQGMKVQILPLHQKKVRDNDNDNDTQRSPTSVDGGLALQA